MSHITAQLMIGVNTAAAIMGVWTSMAAAGPPGWAVAGVMSGVIGALGVSQHIAAGVAYGLNISKLSSSRMADGGIVQGGSSAGDMVPTMMNAEEMVLNKSSQLALFNQLKSGNIGSSGMTVNIGTVETPNAAEFMIDLQRIEAGRY